MRVMDATQFEAPFIICNAEHRFIVAEQMRELGVHDATIMLEPCVRNTAPALAAAALHVQAMYGDDALMLLLPSDHIIRDVPAFLKAVQQAAIPARDGALLTFGITPTYPETGYGYIHYGAPMADDVYRVEQFVEKPDITRATAYLASGEYAWNSGMFLLTAGACLRELTPLQPALMDAVRAAYSARERDLDFIRLEPTSFAKAPSLSIDYAVMEHTRHSAVIALECGWSDAGAWDALWNIGEKDASGNVTIGETHCVDTTGSYIRTDGAAVATLGVADLIIISTKDALLVANRNRAQDVKTLVDMLKAKESPLVTTHPRVYRPWGHYDSIDSGQRHQVKRICVFPHGKLSLQMHHQRAEHWVIVSGTARVTLGDTVRDLHENESIYIPLGAKHRIENVSNAPLELIEVQTGAYLGEDDIVRFEDVYGRPKQDDVA